MKELSLVAVLGVLCMVALGLITYLTFNIRTLENELNAVKATVNDHTGMIAMNGQRLSRVENLIIANNGKLRQIIEDNKQCHAHLKRWEEKHERMETDQNGSVK